MLDDDDVVAVACYALVPLEGNEQLVRDFLTGLGFFRMRHRIADAIELLEALRSQCDFSEDRAPITEVLDVLTEF